MISVVAKVIKAGHLARKLARYISGKAVGMTADLGFGTFKLRRPQLDWAIHALRSHHGESRASEVRHVVLSTPKGTPRREAKKVIRAVWKDFISTYAPERPWMFGLQFHNGILHGHGAISNVGPAGRPLGWKPHQVVAMSEMAFTEHAISAKGRGKKGLPIYTKARGKLAVKDLAALVVDTDSTIKNEVWKQLKKKGAVSDFRNRKDGSLISFEFQGRRIRLATLKHFVEHLQSDSSGNTGSASPPPSGLSSKDVQAINDVLQQASVPQARTPAKSKTRTRNTPKL
jgi:hypothetical protein